MVGVQSELRHVGGKQQGSATVQNRVQHDSCRNRQCVPQMTQCDLAWVGPEEWQGARGYGRTVVLGSPVGIVKGVKGGWIQSGIQSGVRNRIGWTQRLPAEGAAWRLAA